MINLDRLENELEKLRDEWSNSDPFAHVVIDNFADAEKLSNLVKTMPDPVETGINKSRDYVFARNKFEKSSFKDISSDFSELYEDLTSERFRLFLQNLSGDAVFVDPAFHGGGIHQGGDGSFLDMHVDFNYHPENSKWFRNLNILIYLNEGWIKEYGGELKLQHSETGKSAEIAPLFNRCVIMTTRSFTLHGYDRIRFPSGTYRRSIAAYAYHLEEVQTESARSTRWHPGSGGVLKKMLGQAWPSLVRVKNAIIGSSTSRNR